MNVLTLAYINMDINLGEWNITSELCECLPFNRIILVTASAWLPVSDCLHSQRNCYSQPQGSSQSTTAPAYSMHGGRVSQALVAQLANSRPVSFLLTSANRQTASELSPSLSNQTGSELSPYVTALLSLSPLKFKSAYASGNQGFQCQAVAVASCCVTGKGVPLLWQELYRVR